MSRLGAVRLVAGREIQQRLRSRAFIVFTLLIAVAIIGIGVISRLTSESGPDQVTIGVVGAAPAGLQAALEQAGAAQDLALDLASFPASPAAEAALRDGDVVAVLDTEAGRVVFHTSVDPAVNSALAQAWASVRAEEAAETAGLSPDQAAAILAPAPLGEVVLDPEDEGEGVGRAVGVLTAILLFVSVSTFGGFVLTGVVEEKTSAVVEVLLARVPAHILLAGKVLGIGVVALVQLVVAVAAGVVALAISGVVVPSEVWLSLPTTLVWFTAGFALYSTLFALAGSFVSRQEDAQAAAAPITMCFMAAYLLVFTAGASPDSTLAQVLSLLPPFAPLLMPLRIASGAAAWWEVLVAGVLLVGTVWLVLRAAGSVYARTLLHRGSRITWKEALRLRES